MTFPLDRIPRTVAGIARRLLGAGHEAWYVGGAIRDVLLAQQGRPPRRTGDFDIATSARPEEVQALFRRTVPVGIEHGTVAVLDDVNVPHEVTTFRRDVKTDGRHAVVEFGVSLQDDLARRDFTINAIAVHPDTGEVVDPFQGRADLAARLVRAVGNPAQRMREDRLRVLRALRFAASLEFTVDPPTWSAVFAGTRELEGLSRERVRDEWLKTLAAARASVTMDLWRRSGALAAVWPELASLPPGMDPRLDQVEGVDPVLVTLAAMHLGGCEAAAAANAAQRLRFPSRDIERLRRGVAALAGPLPDPADHRAVRRWMAAHLAEVEDVLAIVEPRGRGKLAAAVRSVREARAPLVLADLAVSGEDLMAAGIAAGPGLGATLRRLLEAVLDEPTRNTRQALLALAREHR